MKLADWETRLVRKCGECAYGWFNSEKRDLYDQIIPRLTCEHQNYKAVKISYIDAECPLKDYEPQEEAANGK